MTKMTTRKFTPADYLTPYEINEALRLRQKINNAASLREIEIYESRMEKIIKRAYARKQQGIIPGVFPNMKESKKSSRAGIRTKKEIQGVKVHGKVYRAKPVGLVARRKKEEPFQLRARIRSLHDDAADGLVKLSDKTTNTPNHNQND